MLDLPSDGAVTRVVFDALPQPANGWCWQLRNGTPGLTHRPWSAWHWNVIAAAVAYWDRLGRAAAGDQYVADSGFVSGEPGRWCVPAGAVVFREGFRPAGRTRVHSGSDIDVVIEAVATRREEDDAAAKLEIYAALSIPTFWVIRGEAESREFTGMATTFELRHGFYECTGSRMLPGTP